MSKKSKKQNSNKNLLNRLALIAVSLEILDRLLEFIKHLIE